MAEFKRGERNPSSEVIYRLKIQSRKKNFCNKE